VCVSVDGLFALPSLLHEEFDTVLIDDAERIQMPALIAAASLSKGRVVIAGDPLQREPAAISYTDLSQKWLQRDIFDISRRQKPSTTCSHGRNGIRSGQYF